MNDRSYSNGDSGTNVQAHCKLLHCTIALAPRKKTMIGHKCQVSEVFKLELYNLDQIEENCLYYPK